MPPPGSTISDSLDELEHILRSLPHSLPEPKPEESRFRFISCEPDSDDIDIYGTPDAAINHSLEVAFGWEARSKGVLPIDERGQSVCSLVDALRAYQRYCKDPEADAVLWKWINDIWEGAKAAYTAADKHVSDKLTRRVISKYLGHGCLVSSTIFSTGSFSYLFQEAQT